DYNNPDLAGKIIPGKNFYPGEDPNDVMDYFGHGTFIAGIIGATVNNNYAIAGMNRNVSILNVKVFSRKGDGSPWDALAQGFLFAIEKHAKVINFSAGNGDLIPCSQMPGFQDALNQVAEHGIVC